MVEMADYIAANRANWDDRVPIHVASKFYDVERWLRERPRPREGEIEALGEVSELDVVHLQCHIGLDTLAFANAGARVTGLDFSGAAIGEARSLAERAGLADRARFVEANVLQAAEVLSPERYDLVYVSLGALCWLPSVRQWAAQVAALLRPAGRLYLHDGHPLAWALADDDLRVEHSYFEELEPYVEDVDVTYTDGDARLTNTRAYEWNHSIGEIVTAVLDHGLRVVALAEHDWDMWPRFPWLIETADHRWVTPSNRPRVAAHFHAACRPIWLTAHLIPLTTTYPLVI
jgi:SAM-dependent methyltransferase